MPDTRQQLDVFEIGYDWMEALQLVEDAEITFKLRDKMLSSTRIVEFVLLFLVPPPDVLHAICLIICVPFAKIGVVLEEEFLLA